MAFNKEKEIGDSGVVAEYWKVDECGGNLKTGKGFTVGLKGYVSEKKRREKKAMVNGASMGMSVNLTDDELMKIKAILYEAVKRTEENFFAGISEKKDKEGKVIQKAEPKAKDC
jgi:hypothetical protein